MTQKRVPIVRQAVPETSSEYANSSGALDCAVGRILNRLVSRSLAACLTLLLAVIFTWTTSGRAAEWNTRRATVSKTSPTTVAQTAQANKPQSGEQSTTEESNARRPADEAELRYWLENMRWYHRFSSDEISAATGLSADDVRAALAKFNISPSTRPKRDNNGPLLVLPYPGGRHPRIGFLEGAIRPQRETKVSVFTPWDENSYVVADVPEAIWSNLGLVYLAHTHVPTVWTTRKIELEKLEWNRREDGSYDFRRSLPGGIAFGTKVIPGREAVRIQMWLTNGTDKALTDLRVQNCVMLKGAAGFRQQSNDNKLFHDPYAVCRSPDGKRWIITAWDPLHRCWGNQRCPCLHSDPRFADCPPGETVRLTGWLSFYEGTDVKAELARIEKTGWRNAGSAKTSEASFQAEVVDAEMGRPLPAR